MNFLQKLINDYESDQDLHPTNLPLKVPTFRSFDNTDMKSLTSKFNLCVDNTCIINSKSMEIKAIKYRYTS